jgi:hypothetical protein
MLNRLKIDIDKCITAYISLTREAETVGLWPLETAKLMDAIRMIIKQNNAARDELLNDGTSRRYRT